MNTDSGSTQQHPPHLCLNCGQELTSTARYCPVCGQKTTTGLIPLGSLFREFFETILNIDSRFFHSIRRLFVPGYLTKEFFRGKHVAYFRPLRLFFITMVILYAVLGLTAFAKLEVSLEKNSGAIDYFAEKRALEKLEQAKSMFGYNALPAQQRAFIDSLSGSLDIGSQSSGINLTAFSEQDSVIDLTLSEMYELELDSIYKKYAITSFHGRIMAQQLIRAAKEPGKVLSAFIANTSWMILLLMPALALVLKVLYFRSKRYYVEHLVFLFHYHAAVFVVLIAYVAFLKYLPVWLAVIVPVLCFVFLLLALKAYYQQHWPKTIVKYLTLLFSYLFLLLMFIGFTAMVSFLIFH